MSASRRPDVTSTELLGGVEKRDLVLVDSDPSWPDVSTEHQHHIRAALGAQARVVPSRGGLPVAA